MNSVKNLLVVVLLMGVSYGAFQVINTPDPTLTADAPNVNELDIRNGPRQFVDTDSVADSPSGASEFSKSLVNKSPPVKPRVELDPTASNFLPSLPPGMGSGNMTNSAPELVQINPSASANEIVTTPSSIPANPFPPKSTEPAPVDSNNKVANSNSFASQNENPFPLQPQTNLQPIDPKPVAGVTQPLDRNDGSFNQRTTYENPSAANPSYAPAVSQIPNAPPANSPATGQINWAGIANMASGGNVTQALAELSQRYNDPLPADQRMQMLSWLDQLAGKVIYSTEHLLQARPYIVADGDTLDSIASRWNVPPQLVYNINRSKFGESPTPIPGTELKVVQGPFNAQISIDRMEMTLFLDGMYAGRFSVELGSDHEYPTRSFMIETKSPIGKDYQGATGQTITAGAPNNPYGKYWLGFSNSDLCIHESPGIGSNGDMSGCIRLAARDAEDIYGILSEGSQVSIMR